MCHNLNNNISVICGAINRRLTFWGVVTRMRVKGMDYHCLRFAQNYAISLISFICIYNKPYNNIIVWSKAKLYNQISFRMQRLHRYLHMHLAFLKCRQICSGFGVHQYFHNVSYTLHGKNFISTLFSDESYMGYILNLKFIFPTCH